MGLWVNSTKPSSKINVLSGQFAELTTIGKLFTNLLKKKVCVWGGAFCKAFEKLVTIYKAALF